MKESGECVKAKGEGLGEKASKSGPGRIQEQARDRVRLKWRGGMERR